MLDRDDHNSGQEKRPIDLAHLSRQTLGDTALEREVLGLFLAQTASARDELATADGEARRGLAHRLVGAARAIGAFELADCAAELEASPHSAAAERLPELIDEVQVFLSRRVGLGFES